MGNKRTEVVFSFEKTDLPMIADAFMIARNAALMSGNRLAQQRLEQLRLMIEACVPQEARIFDGEIWAEIGIALSTARTWSISVVPVSWRPSWDRTGQITVEIDGSKWASEDCNYAPDCAEMAAVAALLEDLAPLGAERVPPPARDGKDGSDAPPAKRDAS